MRAQKLYDLYMHFDSLEDIPAPERERLETQVFKKDLATERSLVMMVGKRRKLLDYLKAKEIERYRTIIKKLKIRK